MNLSVYVTGTDTGAGKTVASVALLQALRARGLRATGMKPVASGCRRIEGEWRNADALALQAASAPPPSYALVNPYALPDATAPELAASAIGTEVALTPICSAYSELAASCDVVVVEGVGGWCAPLSSSLDQSALVHALDLPVILVVGLRLGCISLARLSARAIEADGCRLLGWIGNRIDPELGHFDATLGILQRQLPSPCLGVISFRRDPSAPAPVELNLDPMTGLSA
jgi:dethiobiotin synthetase